MDTEQVLVDYIFRLEFDKRFDEVLGPLKDRIITHEFPDVDVKLFEYGGGVATAEVHTYHSLSFYKHDFIGALRQAGIDAAESLAWNLKNAAIRGPLSVSDPSVYLHSNDWTKSLRTYYSDSEPKKWVAWKYKLGAINIRGK